MDKMDEESGGWIRLKTLWEWKLCFSNDVDSFHQMTRSKNHRNFSDSFPELIIGFFFLTPGVLRRQFSGAEQPPALSDAVPHASVGDGAQSDSGQDHAALWLVAHRHPSAGRGSLHLGGFWFFSFAVPDAPPEPSEFHACFFFFRSLGTVDGGGFGGALSRSRHRNRHASELPQRSHRVGPEFAAPGTKKKEPLLKGNVFKIKIRHCDDYFLFMMFESILREKVRIDVNSFLPLVYDRFKN